MQVTQQHPPQSKTPDPINNRNHMGWLSSEAKILFLGSKEVDADVVETLVDRIELLKKVNKTHTGYKLIVQFPDDEGADLNEYQVWRIR